jgi:hypothetical protein
MNLVYLILTIVIVLFIFAIGYFVFLWVVILLEDQGNWLDLDPDEPNGRDKK